ncbi:hypothetical protein D039_1796B, partial [Vibrio parahaemolyticus EKP-028]
PVPVPISKIWAGLGLSIHAPSITPSVLTGMPLSPPSIQNCLNLKPLV